MERAVFICPHVFEATRPVLLVAVEDGDLMMLCGAAHPEDSRPHVVGLKHLIERDPSLREVVDLDEGQQAERGAVGEAWTIGPLE